MTVTPDAKQARRRSVFTPEPISSTTPLNSCAPMRVVGDEAVEQVQIKPADRGALTRCDRDRATCPALC